jgi:hypothetical protein
MMILLGGYHANCVSIPEENMTAGVAADAPGGVHLGKAGGKTS